MNDTRVEFRFYEELNDFLPADKHKVSFAHTFPGRASVKDRIESLGVPHTEVDLILVNGESVGFDYVLQDEDRVSVYPVFESLDISSVTRLRPVPLRVPRFVLDTHLGKLARYLRLLGFDTLYRNDYDDPTLAAVSETEHRTLLTRDTGLLKRKQVQRGYFVRETAPQSQVREVLRRFDLVACAKPFSRCLDCNADIVSVAKQAVEQDIPQGTRREHDTFWRCNGCGKVYWAGSHHSHLCRLLADLLGAAADQGPG